LLGNIEQRKSKNCKVSLSGKKKAHRRTFRHRKDHVEAVSLTSREKKAEI